MPNRTIGGEISGALPQNPRAVALLPAIAKRQTQIPETTRLQPYWPTSAQSGIRCDVVDRLRENGLQQTGRSLQKWGPKPPGSICRSLGTKTAQRSMHASSHPCSRTRNRNCLDDRRNNHKPRTRPAPEPMGHPFSYRPEYGVAGIGIRTRLLGKRVRPAPAPSRLCTEDTANVVNARWAATTTITSSPCQGTRLRRSPLQYRFPPPDIVLALPARTPRDAKSTKSNTAVAIVTAFNSIIWARSDSNMGTHSMTGQEETNESLSRKGDSNPRLRPCLSIQSCKRAEVTPAFGQTRIVRAVPCTSHRLAGNFDAEGSRCLICQMSI